MAGEQAAPRFGHAVTPSRSRGPHRSSTTGQTPYTRSAAHVEPKEPTRATWTTADPPSGWLAGLSGDDPARWSPRSWAPCCSTCCCDHPKTTHHPVPLLATIRDMRCGRQPSGERVSWRWSRWRRRSPAGRWSRPPAAPRRMTRPPRPAGGCARAPTSCSALAADRWPTGSGSGQLPPSLGDSHRRNPTSIVVNRRPRPQGRFAASAAATPRAHSRTIRRTRAFGVPASDPWR